MPDSSFKGLSEKQRWRVEELTQNFDACFYIEKRDSDVEYLPGVLIPRNSDLDPFEVMVSQCTFADGEHVLVCVKTFDAIDWAELVFEDEVGNKVQKVGETSPTRPGRRAEDRVHNPPIQVARF